MYNSPEELMEQIRLGEDTPLELKEVPFRGDNIDKAFRNELADEMAAMGNTHDGVVVLGVNDKTRDVVGIPVEHLDPVERFVYEICNDSITPSLIFRTFRMTIPDSEGTPKPVLKVEIPRSLFVHESPGGYFHRVGSSKRKMPPDYLARLFQQRSQARLIRFDEQVVPGTFPTDLHEPLWTRFLAGERPDDHETSLKKLRILVSDDDGNIRLSVAGALMCSCSPEKHLPGAFIQAVHYRGVVQDSNYQEDAREIKGSLDEQIRESVKFVQQNMKIRAKKSPTRIDMPQYSIRAVFEAIVNAVAHRDYSIHGSKIRLFMFDDRLELYSPGSLPNTITVDSMHLRQSTRNELVSTLLTKTPAEMSLTDIGRDTFLEKRGDGVPIIRRESKELSGRLPEYMLIDDSELLLTIYAAPTNDDDK